MLRRDFLKLAASAAAFCVVVRSRMAFAIDKLVRSNDEWKKILTPAQYDILREEGTERAFTSDLLNEHREGVFSCAGCKLDLFQSSTKFDSGTGWPSFYYHIPGNLEMKSDHKILVERTEYHCARCGGHHGHVFEDGPKPTGLRYCNNGTVLIFTPKAA